MQNYLNVEDNIYSLKSQKQQQQRVFKQTNLSYYNIKFHEEIVTNCYKTEISCKWCQ